MMRRTWIGQALVLLACMAGGPAPLARAQEHDTNVLNVHYGSIKWQKLTPQLGDRSSEIAILHVDPVTRATQLMIRVPKDAHVPMHWHTANETHTVIKGTFIVECDGERASLEQGSYNYMPARMHHQAWTRPDEGALLFITVDGAWDIHWVGDPNDVIGGRSQ